MKTTGAIRTERRLSMAIGYTAGVAGWFDAHTLTRLG